MVEDQQIRTPKSLTNGSVVPLMLTKQEANLIEMVRRIMFGQVIVHKEAGRITNVTESISHKI